MISKECIFYEFYNERQEKFVWIKKKEIPKM